MCDLDMNGFSEEELLNITFEACDTAGQGRVSSFSVESDEAGVCRGQASQISPANRRGPGLHRGAVPAGHDGPESGPGQADHPAEHAGPRGPGRPRQQGHLPQHHEGVDRSVQPRQVRGWSQL